MRRLNLLKQILQIDRISKERDLSPTTRLLAIELNLIASQRGWHDELVVTSRELLERVGYRPSRYSKEKIELFNKEGVEAGFFTAVVRKNGTVYRLCELGTSNRPQLINTTDKTKIISIKNISEEERRLKDELERCGL